MDQSRYLTARLQYRRPFVERLRMSLSGGQVVSQATGGEEAFGLRLRINSRRQAHAAPALLKPVRSAPDPSSAAPREPSSQDAQQPRLLFAHIDTAASPPARAQLEAAGFAVEETFGAGAALEQFQRAEPAATLLPATAAGLELCSAIRKLSGGRHSPLVLLAERDDAELAESAFAAGASDLIVAPVSWSALGRRLRHLVEAARCNEAGMLLHGPSGLPSRNSFEHVLERLLGLTQRNAQQLALLCLEVHPLGPARESFDRHSTRALQRAIAERLQVGLRRGDLIGAGSANGTEFLIALGGASKIESIGQAAQRILDALGPAFQLPDRSVLVSAHLGIAVYPLDGTTAKQLNERSAEALHQARAQSGGGYHFHNQRLSALAEQDHALERDLSSALDEEDFYQLFQPIVDGRDLRVVGLESLLRWEHPERGTLQPAHFLKLAERSDQAARIGEWVCRNACRQLRSWLDQGLRPVRMSINVSATQLRSEGFSAKLKAILAETGVEPRWIRLELDLRAVLSHWPDLIEKLRELRKLGLQLGVDCNGSGAAAISELRHLPLDVLKLSLDHVGPEPTVGSEDGAGTTLAALIATAHQLGLEAVVRGVQNEAQLRFLRQHECDELQGFLIALPLTAEEVGRLLAATKPPTATRVA